MIVKVCETHGPLTAEETKPAVKKRDGIVVSKWLKCRLCMRERDREYWRRNADTKRVYHKKYKADNKEKIAAQEKRNRDNLVDHYVAKKAIGRSNLTLDEIKAHPELIELKRLSILIRRRMKENNVNKKHNTAKRACDRDLNAIGK